MFQAHVLHLYIILNHRLTNGDDTVESDKNIPAKYVILEDMEEEENMS